MTKKDFEFIAAKLRQAKHYHAGDNDIFDAKHNQWVAVVTYMADGLSMANPRFNRERFLEACGYND